ncbi:MAG: penicillin-binding protein [Fusobacteriaceae bacterium]|jgi:penicillin-binding protein 1A|nr:penicillin-binding protein [Fusobacteriaceae bacterium]
MKIPFKKIILFLLALGFIGALGGAAAGFFIFQKYKKEIPDIAELIENYSPSLPTRIYDRNNELIDTIYVESRDVARISEIPDIAKNAFLAIEDKQFYKHHGLHFKRLAGALLANFKAGRTVQGASSITQQLTKNAFLSQERTLSRKIREAILTFEVERRYTKDEILEKYLNEVNFGSGLYGIKTAARQYFRKNLNELNVAEAALLACIPNRPERYNPRRHLKEAETRAKRIVEEMRKDRRINESQYEEALRHKFINEKDASADFVADRDTTVIYDREGGTSINYPDFTNIVTDFLLEHFPEQQVYSGGLTVHTTLDLNLQKSAKNVFENYDLFQKRKYLNGALVTIDPANGHIVNIVGGRDFKSGNFNRATMAKRQVGSSFKPFLYFTAIRNGFETTTVIEDSYFSQGNWAPRNFGGGYYDNVTLQTALDRSLNIVSIKLLKAVGLKAFRDTTAVINPAIKIPDNLTAALGSFEATPLQMAIAYAIFANGGYVVDPILVTAVEDKNGNPIYSEEIRKEKVFDSIDTSIVTSMLISSVRSGSSSRAAVTTKDNKQIAQGGKTGTTNENRTVWFVGITPEYVTAIYVGRDDNGKVPDLTGGAGAAPLWRNYYKKIIDAGYYIPGEFSYLDNHLKNGELIRQQVSPVNGLTSDDGKSYVVRSIGMQLETEVKYARGIAGVLGIQTEEGTVSLPGEEEQRGATTEEDPTYEDIINR